ncbi:MAG: exodeoxyribonuclease V subunit alpha [Syntrophales bacterium]|jgi:exodeoxyribonuclease V alpha subunit|nr:exodeoxyribonuclease V subunit alpha [Syntrophales bacterium]MCK9392310.1 exodeoxyribonuclease V subunit alpha [Syntrophales bacterium]
MNQHFDQLYRQQYLSALDFHFARFIQGLAGNDTPDVALAAALVSRWRGEGHICLDLSIPAGKFLLPGTNDPVLRCPELDRWCQTLSESPVAGQPGEWKPLILVGSRLYLYRYWEYENKLATILKQRMEAVLPTFDENLLRESLDRLFPPPVSDSETDGRQGVDTPTDWQKVAAFTAFAKSFSVISGGPGTGKTFTVAKILAFLSEQSGGKPLRIALTAPTGKAAARMQEAIQEAKSGLPCPEAVKAALPVAASTIHRLLGSVPHAPYSRYHEDNLLPIDVVVVDEGSMIDLSLLSRLVQAIPDSARLILLGDKDQLASVEAGAVFGDICHTGCRPAYSPAFAETCRHMTGESIPVQGTGHSVPPAADCHVELLRNYRFHTESGIAAASRAVNDGDGPGALSILKTASAKDAHWQPLPSPEALYKSLENTLTEAFADYLTTTDPQEVFGRFNLLRILCVLREGPYGVGHVNDLIEKILHRSKIIRKDTPWYSGRPVLITRNDYTARLYNGDIGIVLPDPEGQNEPRVFFPTPEGTFRKILPSRLWSYETVFAMTVHKSQGSEFDRVLCLLPDRDTPLLTRELIYTALTRARRDVTIWGREDVFLKAVSRQIERSSGLRDALWPANGGDGNTD